MIAEPTHNCWRQVAKLNGRSLSQSHLHNGKLAYALDDHTVQLLHLATGKLETLKTGHTKRINNIVLGDATILTASNDGSVRLYDQRLFKQIGCYRKNHNEFYSAAMSSEGTIAGGALGSLVFWDSRNRAELKCFEDSFNEEVTGLEFNKQRPSNLYGCGADGIVSSFDLLQAEEDDSVEWSQRLNNPAHTLTVDNGCLRVHTTDHHLFVLRDGDILKSYSVNSVDTPRHLLWSGFDRNNLGYYSWDINHTRLERWVEGQVVAVADNIVDLDFLEEVEENRALIANEQGELMLVHLTIPEPPVQAPIEPEPLQEQDYDNERMDSNGFIRPNFKQSRKPNFRPF